MTRDTLVQIFSMTKPITGVALMSLYEAGRTLAQEAKKLGSSGMAPPIRFFGLIQ